MAIDITITLGDALEAELRQQVADHNKGFPSAPLTPTEWLRQLVRSRLVLATQQREDTERLHIRDRFKRATPQEQAGILTVLDKYQT